MKQNFNESQFFGEEKISRILLKIAPPVMLAQLIQQLGGRGAFPLCLRGCRRPQDNYNIQDIIRAATAFLRIAA